MCLEHAAFGGNCVDVDGTIRALRGKELVEWVPGDTLDIVRMFGDFANNGAICCVVHSRSVVRATGNNIFPIRAPREVVNFSCRCAAKRVGARATGKAEGAYRMTTRGRQCSFSY